MRRWFVGVAFLFNALLIASDALAQAASVTDHAGDTYKIRIQRDSETSGDDSSGSSHDVWSLTERVLAVRGDGVELLFDLPADTGANERTQGWQFPARIFRPSQGPLILLNAPEAEQRLHLWLGAQAQALCGRWVFTWTAQKIDCDPQSVLDTIDGILPPTYLHEGAYYREPGARQPVLLEVREHPSSGPIYVARMEIDQDAVRRQRAEADVAIAEIMGRTPPSVDAALKTRASERISGEIVTTFETDSTGRVTRRTRITRTSIVSEDGSPDHETTTETTDWNFSSATSPN